MTDRLATPAFRLLPPALVLLGTGNPEALQNRNTNPFPDGALCWVNDQAKLYVLNKTSVAPPSGVDVVQPVSGPGRWVPAVSSASSSNLVVPDLAALAAIAAPTDGLIAYVLTLRTSFAFDLGSALTADGITIVADTGATGMWLRDAAAPALPWTGQETWYIDAINGNDENVGSTNLTALKTHAELERRINGATYGKTGNELVINILSDLPEECRLKINMAGFDPNTNLSALLRYVGGVKTTNATGTLVGFAFWDPTDPTNFGNIATEAGGFNWTTYAGKRLFFPNEATYQYSWVINVPTPLPNEAGRIVAPSEWDLAFPGLQHPTIGAIANNADYEIQTLYSVYGFQLEVTQEVGTGSQSVSAVIQDLDCFNPNNVTTPGQLCIAPASSPIAFARCSVRSGFASGSSVRFCQSLVTGTVGRTVDNLAHWDMEASGTTVDLFVFGGQQNEFNNNTIKGNLRLQRFATMTTDQPNGVFQGGTGWQVDPGCSADLQNYFMGRGNGGAGLTVGTGGLVQYNSAAKPVITGAAGDTRVAGVIVAWAAVPVFNTSGLDAAGIIVRAA